MIIYIKFFRKLLLLTGEGYLVKRVIVIGLLIMTTLSFPALGQSHQAAHHKRNTVRTGSKKIAAHPLNGIAGQQIVPLANHHTHSPPLQPSI
jgi:hypothetical protein